MFVLPQDRADEVISPEPSSSELMAQNMLDELKGHGAGTSSLPVVDYDVRRGVQADMGNGDQWPEIRERSSRGACT